METTRVQAREFKAQAKDHIIHALAAGINDMLQIAGRPLLSKWFKHSREDNACGWRHNGHSGLLVTHSLMHSQP